MIEAQNIVVLGAGESGVGAAILSKLKGYDVFVSDAGTIADNYKNELEKYNIDYESEGHSQSRILEADLIVKSPGIPDHIALIQNIKKHGISIIDELQWAALFSNAKLIAVTGSNGKTTTVRLIYHLLETAGFDVGLAGNIGYSFAKQVALDDKAFYVLEVSSFQLDYITTMFFDIAVLLNITPDHLDRYNNSMQEYIASKMRIVLNKAESGAFIYNTDDENIKWGMDNLDKADKLNHYPIEMPDLIGEQGRFIQANSDFSMPACDLPLKGRHNLFNMQVAVCAAQLLGVSDEKIEKGLATFKNEAHRLESVISIEGVEYINDSKATNVDAVYYALEAMQKDVVWIVGGVDKGNDYSILFPLVEQKVKAIVCMGKDNSKLMAAFKDIQPIMMEAHSVQQAIKIASLYAEKGQVVLLSPACASFDLFNNYKDRGNQFKQVLMQQHKVMTEGIQIELNLNFNRNTVDRKTDDF